MGYTVKCPQCNEINSGSRLNCVKCQTNLIGVSRKHEETATEVSNIKIGDGQVSKAIEKNSNAHINIGLIVGAIGFFIISFFTFGGSFCGGLFISIGMGVISGLLTARYANTGTIDNASRLGAISGGIAGVFALLGQVFGGILPSMIFGMFQTLGTFPDANANMGKEIFSAFFMPSVLNGIIGLIASSIAGSTSASRNFR
ncbi:MAG: hypothetical protein IPP66_04280 [Anaerolineales bacterium]|nr:hypothetical protein [Anaerolineales bacterium]